MADHRTNVEGIEGAVAVALTTGSASQFGRAWVGPAFPPKESV
jgi:hypothetical protein